MPDPRPNVLIVMTDEERYPPPYEDDVVTRWRQERLPARHALRDGGVELHRHYTAATACLPSRASLFTGQYPSRHGVDQTDGLAKRSTDPAMTWLDPDGVPTMGDWFRAAGYRTFYKGKWHISHPDLAAGHGHVGLMANDRHGTVLADGVDAYRRADRLDRFGFSGWIGREPHGADPADTGYVRDPLFAAQVTDLFDDLADDDAPWLTVASFVNPHDIAFTGGAWAMFGFPDVPDHVPPVAEAPSQADGFEGRPRAQAEFAARWDAAVYPQPRDESYRRFYLWLHELVDAAIAQVLAGLEASGMADRTLVVFTSDHGDMVGAHGGLVQKWHVAYDEATRVPLVVRGPGIATPAGGLSLPTSHVDVLPTLLGLAGVDVEAAAATVAETHVETHELVGRDLSAVLRGEAPATDHDQPVYFMTDDSITTGLRQHGLLSGEPYEGVPAPSRVEAVVATVDDGTGPRPWKLARTFEHLAGPDDDGPPDEWELYDLGTDPEERTNLADPAHPVEQRLRGVLDEQREAKRRSPMLRNPG